MKSFKSIPFIFFLVDGYVTFLYVEDLMSTKDLIKL